MSVLQCGRFRLDLSQPQVMAIINLTDDSFSGDGLHGDVRAALARAEQALEDGADLVAFGKPFIANPDLVRRLRLDAPLNEPDKATFYGGGAEGYTDYPALSNK